MLKSKESRKIYFTYVNALVKMLLTFIIIFKILL